MSFKWQGIGVQWLYETDLSNLINKHKLSICKGRLRAHSKYDRLFEF
jgi:hypothetical protein